MLIFFPSRFRVALVQGKLPVMFVKAWESFDKQNKSENDHPSACRRYKPKLYGRPNIFSLFLEIFNKSQNWLVLELSLCGNPLEVSMVSGTTYTYLLIKTSNNVISSVLAKVCCREVVGFLPNCTRVGGGGAEAKV